MRNESHPYTRREFLRSSLSITATSATIPVFLVQAARAAPRLDRTSMPGIPDERILVVIQLSGGNDGLNTLVPLHDPLYRKARPTLALRERDTIRVDEQTAVHASLKSLHGLFDEGEVAWIQNAGYPNPNRSHFRSMEIWHSGSDATETLHSGWVGRYFDHACRGEDPPHPESAVTIGKELPQALKRPGGQGVGVVLNNPKEYAWNPSGRTSSQDRRQEDLLQEANRMMPEMASPELLYLRRTALDAGASSDAIARADKQYRSNVEYPNHAFGRDLQLVAKLILGDIPGRVYYVSIGGFDTHAGQPAAHARLLEAVSDGVAAFRKDLQRKKQWERVVMLGFSEFGRRVAENNSRGTDHGAAGLMFLAGAPVKGGLHGPPPDLANLHRGDLQHKVDFRSVYASVLGDWLGADPKKVLGRAFPPLDLIRA